MKQYTFLFAVLFLLSFSIYAQEAKTDSKKTDKIEGTEKVDSPQITGDKVRIKDGTTTLLEIENEGSAGSIFLPSVGGLLTGSKLYSNGVNLFWGNSQLNGSNGATTINDLSDAKYDGSSLFLGNGAGANDDAGASDTYTNFNTGVGFSALNANTSGRLNTAQGNSALFSNTTGVGNTGSGYHALFSNTTGNLNTAHGSHALFSNTTGKYNTGGGTQALYSNSTGSSNTAFGYAALNLNRSSNNTAFGANALDNNSIGTANTATGAESLNKNTTGNHNTANGKNALTNNTTGHFNTATGSSALTNNTIGKSNTANGFRALYSNTEGDRNTAVGLDALYSNTTDTANTAIGYKALYSNNGGYTNTAIGYKVLYSNTDGAFNTAIGVEALYSNTDGSINTALGDRALYSNTTGTYNTAIGDNALLRNETGSNNTAIGKSAGPGTTYIDLNNTTALGYHAIPTASNQVRIGNGSITSIGGFENWSNLSDGRYKKNIREDVEGIDFIMGLRPISYNLDVEQLAKKLGEDSRTDENGNRIQAELSSKMVESRQQKASKKEVGFIAQEVEELANNLGFVFSGVEVPENDQSMYRLKYAEFVVPLVKAMQEQQEMIAELRAEIDELKGR